MRGPVHVPVVLLTGLVSVDAAEVASRNGGVAAGERMRPGVRHVGASDMPAPKAGTDDETPDYELPVL